MDISTGKCGLSQKIAMVPNVVNQSYLDLGENRCVCVWEGGGGYHTLHLNMSQFAGLRFPIDLNYASRHRFHGKEKSEMLVPLQRRSL